MKQVFLAQCILAQCILALVFAGTSFSESEGVIIRVRALRALTRNSLDTNIATKSLVASTSQKTYPKHGVFIDKGLTDLAPQLNSLPFNHFSLMESETETIALKSKSLIHLMSGDTLAVRPLGFDNGKYCVWFKWLDNTGARIIDTRLHLEPGRSMLTGTDGSNDTGTILAIDVMPAEER